MVTLPSDQRPETSKLRNNARFRASFAKRGSAQVIGSSRLDPDGAQWRSRYATLECPPNAFFVLTPLARPPRSAVPSTPLRSHKNNWLWWRNVLVKLESLTAFAYTCVITVSCRRTLSTPSTPSYRRR